ncbi:DUF6660 family protein [Aquimarina muelleri]|uniref:DUF6660 family protein n=1 Tax=Aquimarina muelleri TaxID=279356 RepID=UPI003F6849F4
MKFFVVILSVYFLGLSFIPCEDAVVENTSMDQEVVEYLDKSTDNHHADLCSPFCSCQCCHVNVAEIGVQPYKIITPQISKIPNTRLVASEQEVNYSILHPPRV